MSEQERKEREEFIRLLKLHPEKAQVLREILAPCGVQEDKKEVV